MTAGTVSDVGSDGAAGTSWISESLLEELRTGSGVGDEIGEWIAPPIAPSPELANMV